MSDLGSAAADDVINLQEKLLYLEDRTSQMVKLNQELEQEQNQIASLRQTLQTRENELNSYELEMSMSEKRLHEAEMEINDLHKQIAELALQQSVLDKQQRGTMMECGLLPTFRRKIKQAVRKATSVSQRYLPFRSIRWGIAFLCFLGFYLFIDVVCHRFLGVDLMRVSRKSQQSRGAVY